MQRMIQRQLSAHSTVTSLPAAAQHRAAPCCATVSSTRIPGSCTSSHCGSSSWYSRRGWRALHVAAVAGCCSLTGYRTSGHGRVGSSRSSSSRTVFRRTERVADVMSMTQRVAGARKDDREVQVAAAVSGGVTEQSSTTQQQQAGGGAGDKASEGKEDAGVRWQLPQLTAGAAKRVVLVRHGESTWNATGRIQGSSDFSVLTEKGEIQAETSRQMLMGDIFDICFHSPLQRSAKTAFIIWGKRSAPIEPIDDLREIDLYSFQGLFKEQGKERFGRQYRQWQVDAANFEIDGHYPVRELWDRARTCWDVILSQPDDKRSILVVAHNAVNQALVATALGLGPEYFRVLLQSNCGVSVVDFTPHPNSIHADTTADAAAAEDANLYSPLVSLNRLNQTPSPPIGATAAGRKSKLRVAFICHGITDSIAQDRFPVGGEEGLNMLGVVQARKTAELLLDVRVSTIFCSPLPSAKATADAICEVQEAADCLGADCIPRFVDVLPLDDLRDYDFGAWKGESRHSIVRKAGQWEQALLSPTSAPAYAELLTSLWERADSVWATVRASLAEAEAAMNEETPAAEAAGAGEAPSGTILVVGHEMVHKAMIAQCLGLGPEAVGLFAMDEGGLSVVDFPDGATGRGVVRCLNYTAHLGRWAVPVSLPTLNDENF